MDRSQRSGGYELGTRAKTSKTLFDEVKSEANLFAAWRHVKKSALSSNNGEIRGDASKFEHAHQTHLRKIGRQLREHRFKFDPAKGVLKDKRARLALNKDPRPIAIASVKNRVVQRAILQVLQPRSIVDLSNQNSKSIQTTDPRLGAINNVNQSKYGVGGLLGEFGGVKPAVNLLLDGMNEGKEYYYKSDIKSFFTDIPTANVIDIVRKETNDNLFADLFEEALRVDLSNPEELGRFTELFPKLGTGVAQGSSLSAFAGNLLLYDLDQQLNSPDTTAVRYIDDLLVICKSEAARDWAIKIATKGMEDFGFSLYPIGSPKSAAGKIEDSFDFLGCTFQRNRCVPSSDSVSKLLAGIDEHIVSSKQAITDSIQQKKLVPPKLSSTQITKTIADKMYGWQKSFDFATDSNAFGKIDLKAAKKLLDFDGWLRRKLLHASDETRLSVMGIPKLAAMHSRPSTKTKP
nr:reverse transcriptase domain-containing protein [Amylibacter sp.]